MTRTRPAPSESEDRRWLQRAARLALRGHGGAEPNPLVGCLLVEPGASGRVVGSGFHARCGEAHAEIVALRDARSRGADPRGATMYVTLEPCAGAGRTGPCTEAIVAAGIGRVVVARRDDHPKGEGGLERLAAAGIDVSLVPEPAAVALAEPFARRLRTGRPWVVAKWAQTIDGRVATSAGESRWISSARSRALVHRERGRVDVILTGIGTVLADDPLLTARGVRRRRTARRVVVDRELRLPPGARLLSSLDEAPLTVACRADLASGDDSRAAALRERGVELVGLEGPGDDLDPLLRHLVAAHEASTVLVEAGPKLVGALVARDLVDELWIFTGGVLLGDETAPGPARGVRPPMLAAAPAFELVDLRVRGGDIVARWRRSGPSA